MTSLDFHTALFGRYFSAFRRQKNLQLDTLLY